ncbi:uncharacterized protein LOC143625354 [Bidens hawaiensis]|uniref:uncharacterized protein LOC143625354 n=1 Tax=Bidens hawaiensis TaxID=980011 RepID=UPI00404B02BB
MASSNTNITVTQQYPYPYPCHVNPSGFVSVKLSGKTNYDRWREQMMCLIQSHDMQGFIDGRYRTPREPNYEAWKRSDTLVKGWMFGSLSEEVMDTVVGLHTAMGVWNKLNNTYSTPPTPASSSNAAAATNKGKVVVVYPYSFLVALDLAEYIPLYRAIIEGDWETAREHFNKDNNTLTAKLNIASHRALHIAISQTENIQFVKNLLNEINPNSLPSMVNNYGQNPLHYAAMVGNTAASKMLVEHNPHLLFVPDRKEYLPIHRAVFSPHKLTFMYLLEACKQHVGLSQQETYHNPFEGGNGALLLIGVINQGILDVAYDLIKEYPDTARTKYKDVDTPLMCIAGKLDLYYTGTRYNFYQRFVYSYVRIHNVVGNTNKAQDIENQKIYKNKVVSRCSLYTGLLSTLQINRLKEDKLKHNTALMLLTHICEEVSKTNKYNDMGDHYFKATNAAAVNDTPEAIKEMVKYFPQAIWSNTNGYYIIQLAIINRTEKVYNLLVHEMNINMFLHKVMKDKDGNNLLHLAAQLAPIHKLNVVSGAALQMQRELQWFQEVEKFVEPKYKEATNKRQETPIMVFRREHKELRKEGEEWMKKTADSYTITAALIVTIVFAAAITVPGGNNDQTGKPVYLTRSSFIIFAVSDALSLFTSTTSLLLFLSILTARYRDEDFLYKLPKRLILGLVMLFLSVTSLMVAFSAALFIVSGQEKEWILIPIAALTCLAIVSFAALQFPLLVELVSATYGGGIFARS